MAERKYRTQDVARTPRGHRVRTVLSGGHVIRIAFPAGARRRGAGKVVQVLHPREENMACNPTAFIQVERPEGMAVVMVSAPKGIAPAIYSRGLEDVRAAVLEFSGKPPRHISLDEKGKIVAANPVLEALIAGGAAGAAAVLASEATKRFKSKTENRRNRKRRNQANAAAQLYESFHGRSPREVLEMEEACCAAGDYAVLGEMRALWLVPVSGELSSWPKPTIDFEKEDGVLLAASPDNTQLYLIGGNQMLPLDFLEGQGKDTTKQFIDLGTAYGVAYATEKKFDNFRTTEYAHEFGEETGERPMAYYDSRTHRILLVGGGYSISPTDKKLGASPGIVN